MARIAIELYKLLIEQLLYSVAGVVASPRAILCEHAEPLTSPMQEAHAVVPAPPRGNLQILSFAQ